MSGLEHRMYKRRANKYKQRLSAQYEALCHEPDLNKPYVFVALHYQPERTTSPCGGIFTRQGLMVDLLSKCAPEGWQIYVKEHMRQFDAAGRGQMYRTPEFFEQIASMPNVRLISTSRSAFELIDNSKAVATVTGAVGWESLVRGKPVLVFGGEGHAYYAACHGGMRVSNRESCVEAMKRIQDGFEVDPLKVRLFLHALERISVPGYVDDRYEKNSGVSYEDNVRSLSQALHDLQTSPVSG